MEAARDVAEAELTARGEPFTDEHLAAFTLVLLDATDPTPACTPPPITGARTQRRTAAGLKAGSSEFATSSVTVCEVGESRTVPYCLRWSMTRWRSGP